MDEQLPEGVVRIKLDGSYGAGPESEITIVTRNPDGNLRETTYVIPYFCLNMAFIQRMNDINFIVGYKIVKGEGPTATGLKELGL